MPEETTGIPNLRFPIATLCDAATVREGTLSILSGGITRLWRQEFPSPMGVVCAVLCEYDPSAYQRPGELRLRIEDADGTQMHEASLAWLGQPLPEGVDAGETISVPLVADLQGIPPPASRPIPHRHRPHGRSR